MNDEGVVTSIEAFADIIGRNIIVSRYAGQDNRWSAYFLGAEVLGDITLKSEFGDGNSPEAALLDYCMRIRGRTLVFEAMAPTRREYQVPQGLTTKAECGEPVVKLLGQCPCGSHHEIGAASVGELLYKLQTSDACLDCHQPIAWGLVPHSTQLRFRQAPSTALADKRTVIYSRTPEDLRHNLPVEPGKTLPEAVRKLIDSGDITLGEDGRTLTMSQEIWEHLRSTYPSVPPGGVIVAEPPKSK